MKFKPWPYQAYAIDRIISEPALGLFMDMGLGKTVCALTAVDHLMYDSLEVNKVLVIAPKRVAEDTWITEATKWDSLRHLRVSLVLGTERQRKEALRAKADVYVINRENVAWLVGYYQSGFPFDMVVIDELSSFKSHKAIRFRSLRMVRPLVKRVVGLTGTPTSKGLLDLWSQVYLLDQGERLGKSMTKYQDQFFRPGRRNGHVVYDYTALAGSEEAIFEKIADICVSMKAEDYIDMPQRIDRTIKVKLSDRVRKQYDDFEREQILSLPDEEGAISAVNAAALTGKLLQFANGAVYDEEKNFHVVHDEKLEALEEVIEAANGQPVLVFYAFRHDLARMHKWLKGYKPQELVDSASIKAWNEGNIPVLLAHPASAGHGLNLQAGGHNIVWMGPTWSLELYQQANARLCRQGQTHPVVITHILAEKTWDEVVMESLSGKKNTQDALMQAIKARIEKYKHKKSA